MSYDVIETFVLSRAKKMTAAEIVQKEGEVQYTKYYPLQLPQEVYPYFEDLMRCVSDFERAAERIQRNFVRCGYYLNYIRLNNLYRYCVQEGLQGYTNFYKFCEDKLGISSTTAKRLISINEKFCNNGPFMSEKYARFGASKLAIMATFKNGLEGKLQPEVTVKTLNKLQKYYASNDWKVDLNTTWREDLKAYETQISQQRAAKSAYLHNVTFEAAKSESKTGKRRVLISDRYKAYTRFFDQTLNSLSELEGVDKEFQPLLSELRVVLKQMQGKVLEAQGKDMLDGL